MKPILRVLCVWLPLSVLLGAAPAPSTFPILDVSAVPHLATDPARAEYAAFLVGNLPRAFAVAASGQVGWAAGSATADAAREAARASCAAKGGQDCAIYADGLDVVWPGREARAPATSGPLIDSMNYAFVPDVRFLWRGPARAAGVYVWAHGKGRSNTDDLRGMQPPPFVRWLNNAGYDVVRFDRAPMVDERTRAAGWLHDGLATLRRSGYARVIVGGQSRGGWNAMQVLDTPGLADAVVAVSPAAHGSGGSLNLLGQTDDFRALLADAPPQRTRVVFVQFSDDPFIGDAERRRALLEADLRPKVPALLVIDRPAGFAGHGGGNSFAFGQRFGRCILDFVTGAAAAAAPLSC